MTDREALEAAALFMFIKSGNEDVIQHLTAMVERLESEEDNGP